MSERGIPQTEFESALKLNCFLICFMVFMQKMEEDSRRAHHNRDIVQGVGFNADLEFI